MAKKTKKKKSYRRTRKDAGWTWGRYSKERGPNGRGLCRLCKVEVPKGRRTFCSDKCVHEWKLTSDPAYVRSQLWKRDKGICALCGTDTVALVKQIEQEFDLSFQRAGRSWWAGGRQWLAHEQRQALQARLEEYGISTDRWYSRRSWLGMWDADHVVPVSEGGGECGLDNFRTLCLKCHKAETKALAQRKKEERMKQQLKPINRRLFGPCKGK
jgi:5-methylcytosine-specific restriction enzyme A